MFVIDESGDFIASCVGAGPLCSVLGDAGSEVVGAIDNPIELGTAKLR